MVPSNAPARLLLRRGPAPPRAVQKRAGPPHQMGFDLQLRPGPLPPPRCAPSASSSTRWAISFMREDVPEEFVASVFGTMQSARQHQFPGAHGNARRDSQLWLLGFHGRTTYGLACPLSHNRSSIGRTPSGASPAAVRFISAEPLLGPLTDLDLSGIDWLIAGGESGPKFRAPKPQWFRDLRDRCLEAEVPFFFKQWGGRNSQGRWSAT